MIWYDLLEESQCQEQQFDRSEALVGAMGIPPSKSTVSRLFEICSDSSVVKINGRSLAEHRFIAIYTTTKS